MKTSNGSAIVEYVIPTAVIGIVVGLGLYYLASDGMLNKYMGSTANMKVDHSSGKGIISGLSNSSATSYQPGDLGGTTDNPVKKCTGNFCVIDFGDFILNDVPDNFGEFVQTNGNAGGTEQLLNILAQLERYLALEPDIPPDLTAKIRDLIKRGKEIVLIEKEFESAYGDYQSNLESYFTNMESTKDPVTGEYFSAPSPINSLWGINVINRKPAGNDIKLENGADSFSIKADYNNIANLLDPSRIFNYQDGVASGDSSSITISQNFNDLIATNSSLASLQTQPNQSLSPMGQYLKELSEVNKDTHLPNSIQMITNMLSEEIFTLAHNVKEKTNNMNTAYDNVQSVSESVINTLNAKSTNPDAKMSQTSVNTLINTSKQLQDLINSPATETDVDLKMICKARGGEIDPATNICSKK